MRPAEVHRGQHQRQRLDADQPEQRQRPGDRIARRIKRLKTEQRPREQRDEGADHRLRNQREHHQRVFARAEFFQVPLLLGTATVHPGFVATVAGFVVRQRHAVGAFHFHGQFLFLLEADIRMRNIGARKTGDLRVQSITVFRFRFDHAEIQRAGETGRDAGRLQPDLEPVDAHIALGHMAGAGVQLRRIVRTHPGAVAAAETDVRVLQHRAVFGELGVRARRAAFQTHRVVAVVARHGYVQAFVFGPDAAFDITNRAKREMRRQVVLLRARRLAGMAGDAVVRGEIEPVLLVTVRIVADAFIAIDVQTLVAQLVTFRHGFDRLTITIRRRVLRHRAQTRNFVLRGVNI